jgi:hypothetical protein
MELLKVTEAMLVALNHAESAIGVAIADEDGLDGAIGEMTLKEISQAVAQYHLWVYSHTHHPMDLSTAPQLTASEPGKGEK